MIEIDGSQGEGGGQILRSSLALSVITGQPFRIFNVRAGRKNPGLAAQHLKSIAAAAAISSAEVVGAQLGSREVLFHPHRLHSGRFRFDIGTAGATTLVLQTILFPLTQATSASSVIVTGGTHVPASPCYHYLEWNWLPLLKRIGIEIALTLEQSGFYPRGGGRVQAVVRPCSHILPLVILHRGPLLRVRGLSAIANLPLHIAERQRRQALLRLQQHPEIATKLEAIKIAQLPSPGKGTLLLLLAEFEQGRACYFSLGELGKPAEKVADEAVDQLLAFWEGDGAIDQFLADQLLLPLSFAQGTSRLRTSQVTLHLLTNAMVIQHFLPLNIEIHGELGQAGEVLIQPVSPGREE